MKVIQLCHLWPRDQLQVNANRCENLKLVSSHFAPGLQSGMRAPLGFVHDHYCAGSTSFVLSGDFFPSSTLWVLLYCLARSGCTAHAHRAPRLRALCVRLFFSGLFWNWRCLLDVQSRSWRRGICSPGRVLEPKKRTSKCPMKPLWGCRVARGSLGTAGGISAVWGSFSAQLQGAARALQRKGRQGYTVLRHLHSRRFERMREHEGSQILKGVRGYGTDMDTFLLIEVRAHVFPPSAHVSSLRLSEMLLRDGEPQQAPHER